MSTADTSAPSTSPQQSAGHQRLFSIAVTLVILAAAAAAIYLSTLHNGHTPNTPPRQATDPVGVSRGQR